MDPQKQSPVHLPVPVGAHGRGASGDYEGDHRIPRFHRNLHHEEDGGGGCGCKDENTVCIEPPDEDGWFKRESIRLY